MKSRRILSIIVLLVLALALASPAYAQGGSRPGMVSFGRDLIVNSGEVINGDVVAFGGNVVVESQAKVNGAVVSFGGNVTSSGEVAQSVVSFGGNVDLRAGSVVLEDVVAFGGNVSQAEGSRVVGNVSKGFVFNLDEGGAPRFVTPRVRVPTDLYTGGPESLLASIVLGVLRAMVTIFVLTAVAVVLVAIFPKPVEGVRSTIAAQPAASAGIGCLGYLAAAAITVPLVITCIGPFLLWAAIGIAFVFGLAAIGMWLGERLVSAAGGHFSPLATAALGTAVVVLLLAVVDIVPVLNCFGWVLWLLVGSVALGAVIWSRFGTQLPNGVTPAGSPTVSLQAPGGPVAPPPGGAGSPGPASTTPSEIAAELATGPAAGEAPPPGQSAG